MKNSTDISKYKDIGELNADNADLLADLEALHVAPVPVLPLNAKSVVPAAPRSVGLRRWRLPVLAAASAAALALFLAGPSLWGGGTSEVSAQTIIQRTQDVAATNSTAQTNLSYHLIATSEDFPGQDESARAAALGKTSMQSTTETWYLDATHLRTESHQPGKTTAGLFGQARNGDDAWFYLQGDDGQLRVVHGPASALVFVKPSDFGASSITDILSGLGSDNCHAASITGDTTVAGRDAYLIQVTSTPDHCSFGANVSPDDQAKIRQKLAASQEGTTTLAVDKQTFVTLSMQVRDSSGALLSQYEVTKFDVGVAAAAGYAYQPPAGVQVNEVTSAADAKMKLAGEPNDKPAPQEKTDKAPSSPNKNP